jgi:hypothetical protein
MTLKTRNGFDFDSFDRFDYDLCEVLLSYLTLRDKIRLECCSKQWKSLIYNKQKLIFISCTEERNDSINLPTNISNNLIKFQKLLKKFILIEEICIFSR